MSEAILHHYPNSPFAEKVRLMLGFKGVAWRSVTIPRVLPKPDLMPLTGGYRKTPVMQFGADIFCDSACIARELERRFPARALFPDASHYDELRPWAGLRPATPTGLPVLGRLRGGPGNLWFNTGPGALGFTLAFGSAQRLAAQLRAQQP